MADAHPSGRTDIAASLLLITATAAAIVVANSGLAESYRAILAWTLGFEFGPLDMTDTVKNWIKTSLMAVFFLFVGLEIKAEFKEGALASRATATLPVAAALGGMAVPALIYLAVVSPDPALMRGWAIPSATDIAFAVGLLQLLGRRVPPALRAFLLAVAVIDDLGAIAVIALFYTDAVYVMPLFLAALSLLGMAALNLRGEVRIWPYLVVGTVLWVVVLHSGINATLAGVATALFVPLRGAGGRGSPLHRLVEILKPWVLLAIMPVFAFANAGVSLEGVTMATLLAPVTLGVMLGLVVGKPLGITLMAWLAIKLRLSRLPTGTGWAGLFGAGCIAGIGFTMSLFIGALAFGYGTRMDEATLGVLAGSIVAAWLGAGVLVATAPGRPRRARRVRVKEGS